MMPIYVNCIQGDASWHKARAGVVTASCVDQIITPKTIKRRTGKMPITYMNQLLSEWIRGTSEPEDGGFKGSFWTELGHDREAEAAADFSLMTGMPVKATGFVFKDESRLTGCSPDWLAGHVPTNDYTAAAEIKTGMLSTVVGYVRQGGVPAEHMAQIQFGLWVTGFERWYFVAHHPLLPSHIVPVEPDPEWQDAFDEHIPLFTDKLIYEQVKLIEMGVTPAKETT